MLTPPLSLAQQLGNLNQVLDIPSPPPLAKPPKLEMYLFEQPWLPVCVLVLVGLIGFFVLRYRAQTKRAALVAGVCLLLAGGCFLLASFVQTSRERSRVATEQLVAAVATGNGATLRRELTTDAKVFHSRAPAAGMGRDEIASFVETSFKPGAQYSVQSWDVEQFQAMQIGDDRVRVQVKVRVIAPAITVPVRAWLRLDFNIQPDKSLQCTGIEAIQIQFDNRTN